MTLPHSSAERYTCLALIALLGNAPAGIGCRPKQSGTNREKQSSSSARASATGGWFTDITTQARLSFVHVSGARGGLHLAEIMGGGVALFDCDGDGDLDVYVTNGNRELPKVIVANDPVNRLFRQEADGRFTDITSESGLGDGGYGMGVAVGDINNDGAIDVYVTNFGPDQLYRNRGDGTFENITVRAGAGVEGWSSSATFFDYDRDGFLDLYVVRYVEYNPLKTCTDGAGRPEYCGPRSYPPVHDVLLHNNGDGTFTDVSERAGMSSVSGSGLGVVVADFNADDRPDVYVANDECANQLWINQGDGTFQDEATMLGAAYNVNGKAEAGMGVVAADFDNDLDLDLFMTHLGQESNTLYRNQGTRVGFDDVSGESGLGDSSVPYTGFGTAAFDIELDGDLDVLVVNGRVVRGDRPGPAETPSQWFRYAEPNLAYLNDGTGRFRLACHEMASLCGRVELSRGLAVGDVDKDGDLDVLITNIDGPARLYRNDAPRQGKWLMVRAIDERLRRDAIDARITVVCGARRLMRTISAGFSYLSASEPVAHFGLGAVDKVDEILVHWPSGLSERFPGPPVDSSVTLALGAGERFR